MKGASSPRIQLTYIDYVDKNNNVISQHTIVQKYKKWTTKVALHLFEEAVSTLIYCFFSGSTWSLLFIYRYQICCVYHSNLRRRYIQYNCKCNQEQENKSSRTLFAIGCWNPKYPINRQAHFVCVFLSQKLAS